MNRILTASIAAITLLAASWAIRHWSNRRGESAGPASRERLESWENEGGAFSRNDYPDAFTA